MNDEEIAVTLAEYGQHIKSNSHRIGEIENQQKEIRELTRSVDKLAQSVEIMAKEQERLGRQIDVLENNSSETFKYWLRTILTAAATGVIGYFLAFIFTK